MKIKQIVSIIICLSIIVTIFSNSIVFAGSDKIDNIVADMNFGALVTGSEPMIASGIKGAIRVEQPDESVLNKAIAFYKLHGKLSASFSTPASENCVVYQFDYMSTDNLCKKSIVLKDGNGKTSTLLKIENNGVAYAGDNRMVYTFKNDIWYRVAAIYNYSNKRYKLYVDGRCVATNIAIDNFANFGMGIVFTVTAESDSDEKSKFYIDTIRVYNDTVLYDDDKFEQEEFNPAYKWEPIITEVDEETVYLNDTFNTVAEGYVPSYIASLPKDEQNIVGVATFPSDTDRSYI